jgi:hypothetical protein
MQDLNLNRSQLPVYNRFIQGDHDFDVWVDVCNLEERPLYKIPLLDGQVDLHDDDGPDRTASLTFSDPERALSFGHKFAYDDRGVIWVNRLLKVRHRVWVPDLSQHVTATPFVGVPTSASRSGAELGLELADKSLLANHGVHEKTYKKGARASDVLVDILRNTGERHYRIPRSDKRLKRAYTVGMKDPSIWSWPVAQRIARKELNWRLEVKSDGWIVGEHLHAHRARYQVRDLFELPQGQTDFTEFGNYVKVTSKRTKKKITETWEGTAQLPGRHDLSPSSLSRNGAPRFLPLVLEDDSLKSKKQVDDRVVQELKSVSDIRYDQSYSIVPPLHLDNHDHLVMPNDIGSIPWDEGSIPLTTGGEATVGAHRWVSRPVVVRRKRVKLRHTIKVKHPKQKKHEKKGNHRG